MYFHEIKIIEINEDIFVFNKSIYVIRNSSIKLTLLNTIKYIVMDI